MFFSAVALLLIIWCCPSWAQDVNLENHFKAYSISPKPFNFSAFTKDQFMEDGLFLMGPILLANPVQKDTFSIIDTTHHLHWYYAEGRDTLIQVNYENQFETTTVSIDSVRFLLVPAQKFPHNPPQNLDHYKCYRIMQQQWLQKKPFMQDQFKDERADSLRRDLFCTPCRKNAHPTFDTFTHYVGYLIAPGEPIIPPLIVQAFDQFNPTPWVDTVMGSKYLLVPTIKNLPPPSDSGPNHYKTWRITPMPHVGTHTVKDQFMTDNLNLTRLEFLSNPVKKIVFGPVVNDTFNIIDPDDHLTWYRATGRDTLLKVGYANQFETTSVVIDSVQFLLVPADKDLHRQDSLDHYKAYRIRNPVPINKGIQLDDQFDIDPENVTSLLPVFFLTPCQKELEPTYDLTTHYVAYVIPPTTYSGPQPRNIADQFFPTPGIGVDVFNSQFLLVPTLKQNVTPQEACCFPDGSCALVDVGTCPGTVVPACLGDANGNLIDDACEPPQSDTGPNHFKTWRIQFIPTTSIPPQLVKDQFMKDTLRFVGLDYLSNPAQKIVGSDTFNITDTTEHLNWYRVFGRNFTRKVLYKNQFESLSVTIDSVKYLLVPAQKLPHNRPDSLDHYKAYRIKNPQLLSKAVILNDQFDQLPEQVTSFLPLYFLTPAEKVRVPAEPRFDTLTHYVAYLINPQTGYSGTARQTIDQFTLTQWNMLPLNSELLLVPTKKICNAVPGDVNGSGGVPNLQDVIYLVNYVFDKDRPATGCLGIDPGTCWPIDPICRGDVNGSGGNPNLQDVIYLVNFVFDKDRIATACLGLSPGNCWCPEPTETCCDPLTGCP